MLFNFTVKFKVYSDAGLREGLLLDHAFKFCGEPLLFYLPDDKGYYRISFSSLRDCKSFLNYLFFDSPHGFCIADAYIFSHDSGRCLRAVLGYRLVDHKRRYVLRYKKC